MYLITLYFDETTNRILQKYINKCEKVSGNDYMNKNHVPPHMTLLAFQSRNIDKIIEYMKNIEIESVGLEFVMSGALLPYVMFAGTVRNDALNELHQKFYHDLKDQVEIQKYYTPQYWVPHVTLAKKLSEEEMMNCFHAMYHSFIPFHGKVVSIGLSKVNPHEDLINIKCK